MQHTPLSDTLVRFTASIKSVVGTSVLRVRWQIWQGGAAAQLGLH